MEKKSPISIEDVLLRSISLNENDDVAFDGRHDFLLCSDFVGIMVQMNFCNDRYFKLINRGVRRVVTATLIDTTDRVVMCSRSVRINISADRGYCVSYVRFDAADVEFRHAHAYRLIFKDDLSGDTLFEDTFRLYSQQVLGLPENWYEVKSGGLRLDGDDLSLYRYIAIDPHRPYGIHFRLKDKMGAKSPVILPELELRVHLPGAMNVSVKFVEPRMDALDPYSLNLDLKMTSSKLYTTPIYVELLCMQYPIAGFVYSTEGPHTVGAWCAEGLECLEDYTIDDAMQRLATIELAEELPVEEPKFDPFSDEAFDKMLDDFIASEMEAVGSVEPEPEPELEPEPEPEPAPSPLLSLDHLTGLTSVKEKLTRYEKLVRFNKMRSDSGLPVVSLPLHAMFLGSPGTGKTTVAKRMGQMLHQSGLLSRGHVVVRERATLLGQNYASESENTIKAIEEAQGGILFIDEAYQLYLPNDARDPGKFVIETLLTALADDANRDWMLILAGYPDEMKRMFDMNPGFKSRVPESNIYQFDDFSSSELMEIAENYLTRYDYKLSDAAKDALRDRLNVDYAHRDKNFGNARHVMNMIQTEILPAMAVRVTDSESVNDIELSEIQASDISCHTPAKAQNPRPKIGYCA